MDLTTGPIARTLILFCLPIVAQMSLQPLYGIIDRMFIGHLGPDSLNAVTNAGAVMMLVISLSAGLANGATSYVARLVGRGQPEEADNAAAHALIIMLGFSALFIAVFFPFDRVIFRLLGMSDPAIIEQAHRFIRIIVLGNLTIMFTLVGANILRGEGDSVPPFIIASATVLINLVLAPPLIFAPEDQFFGMHLGWLGLGIEGGALATVIGRGLGCVALVIYIRRGHNVWTLTFKNFHWHPPHLVEVLRVGLPMLLVNLVSWLSTLVFLRVLNPHPAAVVAFGIGSQLDMLAVMPAIGLTVAVVAMVGMNYGAGRLDRARRTALYGGLLAAAFAGGLGLLATVFPHFWIGLFNPGGEPEIIDLGVKYIYIVGFTYAFVAQAFVLGGAFQGLGKGLPPLTITVTRFILVSIPLVLILPHYLGPIGAWIAAAASHVVGGLMAITWLILEFRKRKRTAPGRP
jgi:putative MATE family efflux protein